MNVLFGQWAAIGDYGVVRRSSGKTVAKAGDVSTKQTPRGKKHDAVF